MAPLYVVDVDLPRSDLVAVPPASQPSMMRLTVSAAALTCAAFSVGAQQGNKPRNTKDSVGVATQVARLQHADDSGQVEAAAALGRMGNAAGAAVPALVLALPSQNLRVSRAAMSALLRVDPNGSRTLPILLEIIEHGQPVGRGPWTYDALRRFGPVAAAAGPTLLRMALSRPSQERWEYISALEAVGVDSIPPNLAAAARDTFFLQAKGEEGEFGERGLALFGLASARQLAELASSPDSIIAVDALEDLAPLLAQNADETVLAAVYRALGDPRAIVRAQAEGSVGAAGAAALPVLDSLARARTTQSKSASFAAIDIRIAMKSPVAGRCYRLARSAWTRWADTVADSSDLAPRVIRFTTWSTLQYRPPGEKFHWRAVPANGAQEPKSGPLGYWSPVHSEETMIALGLYAGYGGETDMLRVRGDSLVGHAVFVGDVSHDSGWFAAVTGVLVPCTGPSVP